MGIPVHTTTAYAYPVKEYIPRGQNVLQVLFKDHFAEFKEIYDEKYAQIYGNYRTDRITEVVEEFLKCGDFKEGVARIKCQNRNCGHDYLHSRTLFSDISRLIFNLIQEYYDEVAGRQITTGLVLSHQTFGDFARPNPHWHGLLLEGGFDDNGNFVYLPIANTKHPGRFASLHYSGMQPGWQSCSDGKWSGILRKINCSILILH